MCSIIVGQSLWRESSLSPFLVAPRELRLPFLVSESKVNLPRMIQGSTNQFLDLLIKLLVELSQRTLCETTEAARKGMTTVTQSQTQELYYGDITNT